MGTAEMVMLVAMRIIVAEAGVNIRTRSDALACRLWSIYVLKVNYLFLIVFVLFFETIFDVMSTIHVVISTSLSKVRPFSVPLPQAYPHIQ